jgi:hypothetical protein
MAALAGVDRRIRHLYRGSDDRHDAPSLDSGWQLDVQSVIAEFAVAKALGWYWPGADDAYQGFHSGDVARLEVRSTSHLDGRLIVHDDDKDDAAYVLVVGLPPRLHLPGWIAGTDAKNHRYWNPAARTPAFFVPQTMLRPLAELVAV